MAADEENEMRARSFRYEDYNNRRVFLRSYPLHWGGEGDEESENHENPQFEKEENEKKKLVKKLFVSIFS